MANESDPIEVIIPVPEVTETPAEVAPVTTVIDTGGSDGVDPAIMNELLELREFKVNAERDAEDARIATEEAERAAANAQVTADVALEVAAEAVQQVEELREGEQAGADEDEVPNREHGWFAPIGHKDRD